MGEGDYRLERAIVFDGRIRAVLDWEMSTLGDPLTDLGTTCVYWDGIGGFGDAFPPCPGSLPGWPSRADLNERHARHGGTGGDPLAAYTPHAGRYDPGVLGGG